CLPFFCFILICDCEPLDLHSFPTRRSSDLDDGNKSYDIGPRIGIYAGRITLQKKRGGTILTFVFEGTGYFVTPYVYQIHDSKYRSEEHTSELQSRENLVCRLLLEKKNSLNP